MIFWKNCSKFAQNVPKFFKSAKKLSTFYKLLENNAHYIEKKIKNNIHFFVKNIDKVQHENYPSLAKK